MNMNVLSPFIRLATRSYVPTPWLLQMRILFEYELLFLEEGKLSITVDGKLYACKPGDIILFCPGQQHEIRSVGSQNISQPHIVFDLEYDQYSDIIPISFRNLDAFTEDEKRMIRSNEFSQLDSPILKVSNMSSFLQLFYDVIDAYEDKHAMYQLVCKYRLIKLLCYLFTCNPEMTYEGSPQLNPSLMHVKEYIDCNYTNKISLDILSKQFHIDKFYLTRRFREEFGVPIIHYYNSTRIAAAKRLLKDMHSVTQTASMLGFDNIYTFSRFFKRGTGFSPKAYAKQTNLP